MKQYLGDVAVKHDKGTQSGVGEDETQLVETELSIQQEVIAQQLEHGSLKGQEAHNVFVEFCFYFIAKLGAHKILF